MAKKILCFYLSKEKLLGDGYLILTNNQDSKEISLPLRFSIFSEINDEELKENFIPEFRKEVNRLVENHFNYKLLFNRETYVGARAGVAYLVAAFSEKEINRFFEAMR